MKKIIISLLFITSVLHVGFAQNNTNTKKGDRDYSHVLPQAGDFSLGMDMGNFIKVMNNNIAGNNNDDMVSAFKADIFGRYFLSNDRALRAHLAFGVDNSTNRVFVVDDVANLNSVVGDHPLTMIKTVDMKRVHNTTMELGIGYEFRRSMRRVQGYAGAEVFGGMNLHSQTYEYGNGMGAANQKPTSAFQPTFGLGYRPVSTKGGNAAILGFGLFAGADFFISRNISIGAEFAFEARYKYTTELRELTETWLMDKVYVHEELVRPSQSSFNVKPVGRFNLSFYF